MFDTSNQQLYNTWEKRWQGSLQGERVSHLGRMMFIAKEKRLRAMLSGLAPSSVIEVGCGLGHTLAVYQAMGLPCIGIDVSPTAVQVCQQKGLNAHLRNVNDETGQYDLVSSDGMLEHFLNFEPMARQFMRLSKRHVVIIQPNHGSFLGKILPCLAELIKGDANVLEYNYRISDFIDVFQGNGFVLRENVPVFGDVFRILLFENNGS